jgi:dihydrofolate reductase
MVDDNSERKPRTKERKLSLFIASSLDGFIARKDGGIDWLFADGDYGYKRFYNSVDTILMGRKTYETALRLGENFAGKTCYVFTRRKRASKGNITFVSDPVSLAKRIKSELGKGIFLEGGGETISTFLNEGLIDEIVLSIHPILIGEGIPLFRNLKNQIGLKLLDSTSFKSGLVQLRFEVKR